MRNDGDDLVLNVHDGDEAIYTFCAHADSSKTAKSACAKWYEDMLAAESARFHGWVSTNIGLSFSNAFFAVRYHAGIDRPEPGTGCESTQDFLAFSES